MKCSKLCRSLNCFQSLYFLSRFGKTLTGSGTAIQKKHLVLFSQLKHFQQIGLSKNRKSRSRLDQKLCQFLFFHCDVIFDKLSKLGQISCGVPYYIKIKDSLYLGKFFVNFFENWYKMRKIIAQH